MRLSARAIGGAVLILTVGLTACGRSAERVTAAPAAATKTTSQTRPAICSHLEKVMSLPEQLTVAASSENAAEFKVALSEASDQAAAASKRSPEEIATDLNTIATTLHTADRGLASSKSDSIDTPSIDTVMNQVRGLFEGVEVLRVAGFQQASCG